MADRDDPTDPVAVARWVAGALPWLVSATGSDAGDGAGLGSEPNQFRGFNCRAKPLFCLGRLLLATGAASVIEVGLVREVFVVAAFANGSDWFSARSCASLIGSSSSRRTTSTFTGGADGLSALA